MRFESFMTSTRIELECSSDFQALQIYSNFSFLDQLYQILADSPPNLIWIQFPRFFTYFFFPLFFSHFPLILSFFHLKQSLLTIRKVDIYFVFLLICGPIILLYLQSNHLSFSISVGSDWISRKKIFVWEWLLFLIIWHSFLQLSKIWNCWYEVNLFKLSIHNSKRFVSETKKGIKLKWFVKNVSWQMNLTCLSSLYFEFFKFSSNGCPKLYEWWNIQHGA